MRDRYPEDEPDRAAQLFVAVAIAAFAVLAWGHFRERDVPEAALSPEEASLQGVDLREGSATSVRSDVVRPTSDARRSGAKYVGVYECTENGLRVVSDRPCGPGATARVLVVDPPKAPPPPVPTLLSSGGSTANNRSAGGSASAPQAVGSGNETACAAVDREIDALNARMREGYGPQAGEVYRERWHALKERRYELGCGR